MTNTITRLRKIRRAYTLETVHHDDTKTHTLARFPSRRWWASTVLLALPHGKLSLRLGLWLAWRQRVVFTSPPKPPRPSALRSAHQAGLESLTKPPSRTAMIVAVILLLAAIGWRIYQAWPPAPKPAPANPAAVVWHAMARCSGTGVYTRPDGTCVIVPAR